jgi:hypothetical protein
MFKRRFLILIGLLIFLGAVVPQSFAQQGDELYNKLTDLFGETNDVELLPLILNEIFPQGIVPAAAAVAPDGTAPPPEQIEVAGPILGEFIGRAGKLIALIERMALNPDVAPDVKKAALRVESFVQYYKTLVEMTAANAIPLEPEEPPVVGAQQGIVQPIIIRQFVNPLFITYWRPWPDHPREIEEKVFTAEIPIWGAAVVVKEVRGVKLELVRGPLPINPCWWWRLYRIPWHWWWHYYRLVPSEFIKTISYINTWNFEKRQPELIQKIEKEIVLDQELMKFWWFLSDPKAAPEMEEGETLTNMGSSQGKVLKRKAVVWGNLKRIR